MKTLFMFFSAGILLFGCNSSGSDSQKKSVETQNIVSVGKQNRLEVYCFHGTRQCETCKNMKANTRATLDTYFSALLKDSSIVFLIIDVDDEKNERLAEKFQATGTALMINKVVNGKDSIVDWSDFAFEKANEKDEFISGLKNKIETVLK